MRYLVEVAYTTTSLCAQVNGQTGRLMPRIAPLVHAVEATVEFAYYTFGDSRRDLLLVMDFPGPPEAQAFRLAALAGGSLKSFELTPLLSLEEGVEAFATAHQAGQGYRAPVPNPHSSGHVEPVVPW
jgi:hypothetical protein